MPRRRPTLAISRLDAVVVLTPRRPSDQHGEGHANCLRERTDMHEQRRKRSSSRAPPAWSAATRPRRPCGGAIASAPWSAPRATPAGSTSGASRRSSATWKTPRPCGAASPGPTGSSTAPPRSATGAPWRSSAGSTSRRSGSCSTPPSDAEVERFVHVSSLGVYEGRDHSAPTRPCPRPPNRSTPTPDRRSRPRTSPSRTSKNAGCPLSIVRPGFIYGPRDRTVLPKLLDALRRAGSPTSARAIRRSTASTSRTWSTAIFLAAEVPAAIGEVFNLTDGGRVSKKQFVGRVAELAGLKPAAAEDPALARLDPRRPDGTPGQAARADRARRSSTRRATSSSA